MSAQSGITVSNELTSAFSDAVNSSDVRFLKIIIQNEYLVPDQSIPKSGSLEDDLDTLGDILEDDVPAYVLVRLDDPSSAWLALFYVPDTARVRDKMLYAATRSNLTKSLGAAHFSDSLFATSKNDVTAEAYRKHKVHMAAPKPMSEREKEMETVKAAEREGTSYEENRVRRNHIGARAAFGWDVEAEHALKELAEGQGSGLIVLAVDPGTETIQLSEKVDCEADGLGSALPLDDPCFGFFAWVQTAPAAPHRQIIFIYSCPSGSPVKHRMLYSSGARATYESGKAIIGDLAVVASRKVETSDPDELNEAHLRLEFSATSPAGSGTSTPRAQASNDGEKKPFARPRGPARRH